MTDDQQPADPHARGPVEEPLSYETSVEEAGGQYQVVVTTVHEDGARRQVTSTHARREQAEKAADLVERTARRYEQALEPGDPDAGAGG